MVKEKMLDVKCSICGKNMKMPASFTKNEIDFSHIPHICSDCADKMGDTLGNKKMKSFMEDVKREMETMDKKNEIAEKIAEEITNENIVSLLNELEDADASEEDKIKESFFRGAWTALFLIGNHHKPDFLEEEAKHIRDFNEKAKEREKNYQKK